MFDIKSLDLNSQILTRQIPYLRSERPRFQSNLEIWNHRSVPNCRKLTYSDQ